MSEPLRYILIGAGGQSAHWARTVLPPLAQAGRAVPVAVVESTPEKLEMARSFLGIDEQHCFADPAEAIEKRRADFALIAAPCVMHEKLIDVALTFDLHVLCDAPVADTMESALRIYRKSKIARRKVAVALSQRFDQDKQTLYRLLQSRQFGRLDYLVLRFTDNNRRSPQWGRFRHEMDDPLLLEAATQHLDVLRLLAGARPKTVQAMSWSAAWADYRGDCSAAVLMEMENAVRCVYEGSKATASTLNGWNNEYIRAECEHATLVLDRRQIQIYQNVAMEEPRAEFVPLLDQPPWAETWAVESFCEWIRGASDPPHRLKEAVRSAAMPFAAIQAARTGKTVDFGAFLRGYIEAEG